MTFQMFNREFNINREVNGKLKSEMLMLVVCGLKIGLV